MKIWIIDHYAVPVKYHPLVRNTNFAKILENMGHEVIIFAASSVHNSNVNLRDSNKPYTEIFEDNVHYVLVNCRQYMGNGIKRIANMFEFAVKLPDVCKRFEKPDAILAQSMTPLACAMGIRLGKKYKCKKVAEITDLWPETIVAYGVAGKYNPAVLALRWLEKWIYKNADAVIFSMEGAYEYIKEQGWEKEIPRDKVHYINNGIELDVFNENKEKYQIKDEDLECKETFKVVYTGSIRKVNNLGLLLDAAKLVKNQKVKFLIWGDGDERVALEKRVQKENIKNVIFKGRVEKKYIPYITTQSDLNVISGFNNNPVLKYGISANKLFDYMAAGKPILSAFFCKYNPVLKCGAGVAVEVTSAHELGKSIDYMSAIPIQDYEIFCQNALNGVKEYDFEVLTKKLISIIENC